MERRWEGTQILLSIIVFSISIFILLTAVLAAGGIIVLCMMAGQS